MWAAFSKSEVQVVDDNFSFRGMMGWEGGIYFDNVKVGERVNLQTQNINFEYCQIIELATVENPRHDKKEILWYLCLFLVGICGESK